MIYLVERTDEPDYEEDRAVVVRATSVRQVREIVAGLRKVADSGGAGGFRADGSNYSVTTVPSVGPAKIILIDNVGS